MLSSAPRQSLPSPRVSAVEEVLAMLGEALGVTLVTIDRGVIEARWCERDLPSVPLPSAEAWMVVADTASSSRFSHHPLVTAGITALVALPFGAEDDRTTLWVGRTGGRFGEREERSIRRAAVVLEQILSVESESRRYRRFTSLMATPAIYVHAGVVFLNRAAETLTGYRAHEVDSLERWFDALYGADAATLRAMYELDRQHDIEVSRVNTIRRKDGHERMVEFASRRDGEHELWLLHDVTERVASHERFRALFDQTSTALTLYDEGGIIDCNPAALALLGYSTRTELLQRRPETLSAAIQSDGRTAAGALIQMETIALTQGSHRFDWLFKTRSGTDAPVEVTLTPLSLSGRRVLLAEWHDISERLTYQAGLEAARDSALSFAQARSDFLATMSHEIRTPMNGVIGMTRLLSETSLDAQQREYVNTVRACGEGLLALINDILDFSRLEAGKVHLERIAYSVREVVEDATSVLATQAHAKKLELCCLIARDVPALSWGDPTRLRQVLLNLVSNAVKFTQSGSVELTVSVDQTSARRLRFDVKDSGIGIAPEALPRLFTAFSQEDSSTTRRFGGSGLGLAICRRLAELMKGTIEVQSGHGGTRFTVFVPLEVHTLETPRPGLRGFKVALLETREVSRRALLAQLEGTGVVVVSDPREAQLVLVDQGFDGAVAGEVARRYRTSTRQVGLLRRLDGVSIDESLWSFVVPTPVREQALHQQLARSLLGAPEERTQATQHRQFGARILVAEDNLVNQRVVKGLLTKLGCEVVIAENGARAVEQFQASEFDLIFMDCQMPELDGFEATRRIRAVQRRRVPIVALTAGVMVEDRERCLSAGMDAFLVKPVRLEDLERTLTEELRIRESGIFAASA